MSAAYLFLGVLAHLVILATVLLLPWPGLANVRLVLLRVLAIPVALARAVPAWVWALASLLVLVALLTATAVVRLFHLFGL